MPRPGIGSAPESANMPASRMKPGETSETPTPLGIEVGAQAEGEAAQAELGRVVDEESGLADLPESEEMKTMCPEPRSTIAG